MQRDGAPTKTFAQLRRDENAMARQPEMKNYTLPKALHF
jgi:hypothetical protein